MKWQQIYNQEDFVRHVFNQKILQKRGLAKELFNLIDVTKPTVLIIDINCNFQIDSSNNVIKTHILDGEPQFQDVRELLSELPPVPLNIVGIGGGSSIDFAKSLLAYRLYPESYRVGYDSPRDLFENSFLGQDSDTLISIPTTVSSGSEASRYALLFFDSVKMPIRHWSIVPSLVILDSDLLKNFNNPHLLYQHFDTFVHALEVTYCRVESNYIARNLVNPILEDAELVIEQLSTNQKSIDELNSILQVKALLAGNAISNVRTGALHTVGESLASCFRNLRHVDSLYFASAYYDLITNTILSKNLSFRKDFSTLKNFRDSIRHLVLQNKGIEQIKPFQKFIDLALSDKVLWDKEHFSSVTEKELLNFLTVTWDNFIEHTSQLDKSL